MGKRIPLPIVTPIVPAGSPVVTCWGPGKDFGESETPIQVVARVSGIVKGPLWIPADGEAQNGEFILDQHPTLSTRFRDLPLPFTVRIIFRPLQSVVQVLSTTGIVCFTYVAQLVCQDFTPNQEVDHFMRGTVRVWLLKVLI